MAESNSQNDKISGKLNRQNPQVNHHITRSDSKTLKIEIDKWKKEFLKNVEELSQDFEIIKEVIKKQPQVQIDPDIVLKLMENVKMHVNKLKALEPDQQCFSGGYSSSLKYLYKSKIKILMI